MAVHEQEREINLSPDEAFDFVEQKLQEAGFKDIQALKSRMTLRGEMRTFGQWTKSPMEVSITGTDSGSSIILVSAVAQAQSLSSGNPAKRMVEKFINSLES